MVIIVIQTSETWFFNICKVVKQKVFFRWRYKKVISKAIIENNSKRGSLFSRYSFPMMVRWANDGVLQTNATKMLIDDVKCSLMMVKCSSMMVKWVYDPTLISPSLTSILVALAWSTPLFAHLKFIEKLHRLNRDHVNSKKSKGYLRGGGVF